MDFKDKVVIITGAAGGIGKATAKLFANEGAKLTLVDLNKEGLEEVVSELNLSDEDYIIKETDVSKEEQVKEYVDLTLNKFGRIDAFVNNAGIEGKVMPIVETSDALLDLVLGVNVKGVYFGLKHIMPVMMEQKSGNIVNVASVAGFIGSPGMAPYIASKHAVLGINKCAALESASFGIRVNAVCPGPVDNRMMESIQESAAPGHGDEVRKQFERDIPIGRYSTNEEVANLIYYMSSDKSSGITGTAYRIDGGMAAK